MTTPTQYAALAASLRSNLRVSSATVLHPGPNQQPTVHHTTARALVEGGWCEIQHTHEARWLVILPLGRTLLAAHGTEEAALQTMASELERRPVDVPKTRQQYDTLSNGHWARLCNQLPGAERGKTEGRNAHIDRVYTLCQEYHALRTPGVTATLHVPQGKPTLYECPECGADCHVPAHLSANAVQCAECGVSPRLKNANAPLVQPKQTTLIPVPETETMTKPKSKTAATPKAKPATKVGPVTTVDPRLATTFGLRAFPDLTFRISPDTASLICNDGEVVVQSKNGPDGGWLDFAREQQDTVLSCMTPDPNTTAEEQHVTTPEEGQPDNDMVAEYIAELEATTARQAEEIEALKAKLADANAAVERAWAAHAELTKEVEGLKEWKVKRTAAAMRDGIPVKPTTPTKPEPKPESKPAANGTKERTPIPDDATLKGMSTPDLANLCKAWGIREPMGAGHSTLFRLLINRRSNKPSLFYELS